jgi:hypothetical protein
VLLLHLASVSVERVFPVGRSVRIAACVQQRAGTSGQEVC